MKRLASLAVGSLLLAGTAHAGELDAQFSKVVKTFSRTATSAGVSTATVAVLPYRTTPKLADQRVDLACSELLTSKFIEAKTFKLVERAQLDQVMKEQKLGLTGAIQNDTAAKVGQLVGARLVVIGSVSKVGDSYNVSSELVDSASGEILASDVFQTPTEVFEADAKQYLVLAPEEQRLGFYLGLAMGPSPTKSVAPFTVGGVTYVPANGTVEYGPIAVGVRYSPVHWLMFDLGVQQEMFNHGPSGPGSLFKSPAPNNSGSGPNVPEMGSVEASSIRFSVSYARNLTKHSRGYAGLGIDGVNVKVQEGPGSGSGTTGATEGHEKSQGEQIPFLQLGYEYRIQQRFGIDVFGHLNFPTDTFKGNVTAGNSPNAAQIKAWEFSFPQEDVEVDFSFYF